MKTQNHLMLLAFISSSLWSSLSHSSILDKLRPSKVTYNRDGSVTYKKPVAHNGSKYFPIRYDTPIDFDSACKLMGHDLHLKEPGLNKVSSNDDFKLMFNKDGSLEDIPVSNGDVISKLTCYSKEKIKSSIHATVKANKDGTYLYTNIHFLRGDLRFWIAYDDEASPELNYDKICRLLDKKGSAESRYSSSFLSRQRGLRAIVDETPKFIRVEETRSYVSQVTCLPEPL